MSLVDKDLYASAAHLLEIAGFNASFSSIEPIHQGGNNQIFHIKDVNQDFILKKYFQHPEDKRNRLEAEYSFLEFAYKQTPQYVPKPFSKDDSKFVALYEFIDGVKITSPEDIKNHHIEACVQFISDLNQPSKFDNTKINNASEACFSINDHLNAIDNRINELIVMSGNHEELKEVMNQIHDKWVNIKDRALKDCAMLQISTEKTIPLDKRVISPSDFGFHNALIQNNGAIKFIDFEYAGWDDPAKLTGDFFGQVAIPINPQYQNFFLNSCFKEPSFTQLETKRIRLLIDSYKIKWCCIVLNIFISKNLSRRLFSSPTLDIPHLQSLQLNKAAKILESLNS